MAKIRWFRRLLWAQRLPDDEPVVSQDTEASDEAPYVPGGSVVATAQSGMGAVEGVEATDDQPLTRREPAVPADSLGGEGDSSDEAPEFLIQRGVGGSDPEEIETFVADPDALSAESKLLRGDPGPDEGVEGAAEFLHEQQGDLLDKMAGGADEGVLGSTIPEPDRVEDVDRGHQGPKAEDSVFDWYRAYQDWSGAVHGDEQRGGSGDSGAGRGPGLPKDPRLSDGASDQMEYMENLQRLGGAETSEEERKKLVDSLPDQGSELYNASEREALRWRLGLPSDPDDDAVLQEARRQAESAGQPSGDTSGGDPSGEESGGDSSGDDGDALEDVLGHDPLDGDTSGGDESGGDPAGPSTAPSITPHPDDPGPAPMGDQPELPGDHNLAVEKADPFTSLIQPPEGDEAVPPPEVIAARLDPSLEAQQAGFTDPHPDDDYDDWEDPFRELPGGLGVPVVDEADSLIDPPETLDGGALGGLEPSVPGVEPGSVVEDDSDDDPMEDLGL